MLFNLRLKILFLAFFISMQYYSQEHNRYWLKDNIVSKSGTDKVEALLELANSFESLPDSLEFYANSAYKLANSLKYNLGIGKSLNKIGRAYFLKKEYLKALSLYFEAEVILRKEKSPDEFIKLLMNIGDVYYEINKVNESFDYYKKALSLLSQTHNYELLHAVYNDLGLCYWKMNQGDSAISYHKKSLHIRKNLGLTKQIGQSLNNIGVVYWQMSQLELALEYFLESLNYRKLARDNAGISTVLNNVGLIYYDLKNFEMALRYYKEALEISLTTNDPNALGYSYSRLGHAYEGLGVFDSALIVLKLSNENYEIAQNALGIISNIYRIGNIHLSMKNPSEALKLFNEGLNKSKLYDDKSRTTIGYYNIGRAYLSLKQYEKAIFNFKMSEKICLESNFRRFIQSVYEQLADAYYQSGRFKDALLYYKLFNNSKDSLITEGLRRSAAEFQTRYQLEKTNRELEKRESEIQRKALIQRLAVGASFIFLVLAVLSTLLYIQKRKANLILKEQSEKLKEAYGELNKAADELSLNNAAKDKFISIIAHDLKNPFHQLLGYSQILSSEFDSISEQDRCDLINGIHNTTNNTYKLLENLLNWARAQKGEIKINKELFVISDCIKEAISHINANADKKNIKFNQKFILKSESIYADKNIAIAVLRNFLSNAVKFSHPSSAIEIVAEDKNNHLDISVIDAGVGIDKDKLKKLFRLDSIKPEKGTENEVGSGFGLMLCKDLLTIHKGALLIESERGKGSKFTMRLPREN